MAYEVFKRTGARVETPTLAITVDGRIAINAAGIRMLRTAAVRTVLLLWDKTNHKLGIKATHRADRNAYAVSVTPEGHSGSIRAKSFLSHIGWTAPKRVSLPATWNEGEKMFELEVPTTYLGARKATPPSKAKTDNDE